MPGKRFSLTISLLLLVALVSGLGWIVYAPIRLERLNHFLITALKHHNTKSGITLLADGADPNACDEPPQQVSLWRMLLDRLRGNWPPPPTVPTALQIACWQDGDNLPLVKALLDRGAAVEAKDQDGKTALMMASLRGNTDLIRLMLEHKASVRTRDSSGKTALMYAVFSARVAAVRLLLDQGAAAEESEHDGDTPLIKAAALRYRSIVQLLLDRDAKVNASNQSGETALLRASVNGYSEIVRLLLDRGANVNARMKNGETALTSALSFGRPEMALLLVENGAEVNIWSANMRETPLLSAVQSDNLPMVKALLARRADVNKRDWTHRTALQYAAKGRFTAIQALLKQAGAKK